MKKQGSIFWKAVAAIVVGVCAVVLTYQFTEYLKSNVSTQVFVWLGIFCVAFLACGIVCLLTEIRDGIYGLNSNSKPADKDDCDNTYRVNEYGSMKDKRCE